MDAASSRLVSARPDGGKTLRQWVWDGNPFPPRRAAQVALDLAGVLKTLHDGGSLHGTLNADAVFVSGEGRAVLVRESADPPAEEGWAPQEQRGGAPSRATDLYRLGGVLLFALTGRVPASFGLPDEFRQPPHWEGIPAPLRSLLQRLLNIDPGGRPREMVEVVSALEHFMHARPGRRAPLLAAALLAALGAGVMFYWGNPPARPESPPPPQPPSVEPAPIAPSRTEAPGPRFPILAVLPTANAFASDMDGGVYLLAKDRVLHFAQADLTRERTVFSQQEGSPALAGFTAMLRREVADSGRDPVEEVVIGLEDGGLLRLRDWRRVAFCPPPKEGNRIDAVLTFYRGAGWKDSFLVLRRNGVLEEWDGALRLDPVKGVSGPIRGLSRAGVRLGDGTVAAMGTWAGGDSGIFSFDGKTWKRIYGEKGPPRAVNFVDGESLEVAGTRSGLIQRSPSGEFLPMGLAGEDVRAFAKDQAGRLWFGLGRKGLGINVNNNMLLVGVEQGLPDAAVKALAVDRAGKVWVSWSYLNGDGGTLVYDGNALAGLARPLPFSNFD